MNATELHNDTIVIDGLIIANWSREIFEQMHQGGLTMANCTCAVWEGTEQTLANIAQLKRWFTEHDDLITQVHSVADIRRAKSVPCRHHARLAEHLCHRNRYRYVARVSRFGRAVHAAHL